MLDPALFPAPADLRSPLDTRDWKSGETDPDLLAALQLVDHQAYDEALVKVKAVLAKDPDSAAAHEVLGVVLAKQNSLDEALNEFRKAAELDPHQSTPLTKIGDVYLAKQDPVNAKNKLPGGHCTQSRRLPCEPALGPDFSRRGGYLTGH